MTQTTCLVDQKKRKGSPAHGHALAAPSKGLETLTHGRGCLHIAVGFIDSRIEHWESIHPYIPHCVLLVSKQDGARYVELDLSIPWTAARRWRTVKQEARHCPGSPFTACVHKGATVNSSFSRLTSDATILLIPVTRVSLACTLAKFPKIGAVNQRALIRERKMTTLMNRCMG